MSSLLSSEATGWVCETILASAGGGRGLGGAMGTVALAKTGRCGWKMCGWERCLRRMSVGIAWTVFAGVGRSKVVVGAGVAGLPAVP
jgi:hypothetical protein